MGTTKLSNWIFTLLIVIGTLLRIAMRGLVEFDWNPLVILGSLFVSFDQPPIVGWCLGWVLYWGVFYTIIHRVYPVPGGDIVGDSILLRGIFATAIVGFGISLEALIDFGLVRAAAVTGAPLPSISLMTAIKILIGLTIIVYSVSYLVAGGSAFTTTGIIQRVVTVYTKVEPDIHITDANRQFIEQLDSLLLNLFLIGTFGFAAVAASVLFPTIEILVLLGYGADRLRADQTQPSRLVTIENQLFRSLRAVRVVPKGISCFIPPIAGIFNAISIASLILTNRIGSWRVGDIFLKILVGIYVGYILWYWYRILLRLPYFVEAWDNASIHAVTLGSLKSYITPSQRSETHTSLNEAIPRRPPGLLLQPTLLLLIFHGIELLFGTQPLLTPRLLPVHTVVLVVYVGLWFGLWWVWEYTVSAGNRVHRSHLLSDNLTIPTAMSIQLGGLGLVNVILGIQTVSEYVYALVGAVYFVLMFYFHDALRFVNKFDE